MQTARTLRRTTASYGCHHLLPQRGLVGAAAYRALGTGSLSRIHDWSRHPCRRLLRYAWVAFAIPNELFFFFFHSRQMIYIEITTVVIFNCSPHQETAGGLLCRVSQSENYSRRQARGFDPREVIGGAPRHFASPHISRLSLWMYSWWVSVFLLFFLLLLFFFFALYWFCRCFSQLFEQGMLFEIWWSEILYKVLNENMEKTDFDTKNNVSLQQFLENSFIDWQ